MADIFVSYSRLDHERVKPIVDRLGSLGYSVWWDTHTRTGQAFDDEVERQLDEARAVLVVWSESARNSTWVFAEAARALDGGKLAQLRIDAARPPAPFRDQPISDVSGGERGEWGPLEAHLNRLVREGASAHVGGAQAPGLLATPAAAGAPTLISVVAALALAACAVATSAAFMGLITPGQLQLVLFAALGVGGLSALLTAQRLASIARAGG